MIWGLHLGGLAALRVAFRDIFSHLGGVGWQVSKRPDLESQVFKGLSARKVGAVLGERSVAMRSYKCASRQQIPT